MSEAPLYNSSEAASDLLWRGELEGGRVGGSASSLW